MTEPTEQEKAEFLAREEWRKIPNYSGYEVSNYGRVRSWRHKNGCRKIPKILKLNNLGSHYGVQLFINGICYPKLVHRLVLAAFVGPCPKNKECCHKDGDGFNNFINNLYWGSSSDNAQDSIKHDTFPFGSKNGLAKLTEENVIDIRNCYKYNLNITLEQLGLKYGVDQSTIWKIIKRKTWRHI